MIADESVNKKLIDALRKAGHSVMSVAEEYRVINNKSITKLSLSPPNIIISEDKDFGELVYHQKVSIIGVILLRYNPSEFEIIKDRLLAFIFRYKFNLHGKICGDNL